MLILLGVWTAVAGAYFAALGYQDVAPGQRWVHGLAATVFGLVFAIFEILFVLVLAASRYVSLASIISAAAFPAIAWLLMRERFITKAVLESMVAIVILIIAKHHANIRRLLNGTENRFGKKKPEQIMAED